MNLFASDKPLTSLAKSKGINTFDQLMEFTHNLPYGRNANRRDFRLVLTEMKGTCSSKHGLIKEIANENNLTSVELVLILFHMNERNTPHIKPILNQFNLAYIPEAHCCLLSSGTYIDITFPNSNYNLLEKEIISTEVISPTQLLNYKVEKHKKKLKDWVIQEEINYTFGEIWAIREKCIAQLST